MQTITIEQTSQKVDTLSNKFSYYEDLAIRNDCYVFFDSSDTIDEVEELIQGEDFQVTDLDGNIITLTSPERNEVNEAIIYFLNITEESHCEYDVESGCWDSF